MEGKKIGGINLLNMKNDKIKMKTKEKAVRKKIPKKK